MSLKDRLAQVQRGNPSLAPTVGVSEGIRTVSPARTDPVGELRLRAQESLFARLGGRLYDASMSNDHLTALVVQELNEIFAETDVPLTSNERDRLVVAVTEDVLGFGPIQEYLDDPEVTEIMVNSTETIYVEREGRLLETEKRFVSVDHLRRLIDRIVGQVGRRIDEASPMVDARLADGSRINAIIAPLAVDGPMLTIRKFSRRAFAMSDLIGLGSLTPKLATFLEACVKGRVSIIVSGGTGTGKTSMLNALSGFLPADERIITIEDAVELQLQQRHRVRLESRPANIEGRGVVSIRDLVRNALRMRPDRILVGEVRGPEALDMLQAMNTGHEGSLTTLHANSPRDTLARLETMVLMAGMDLPLSAVREQIASAIDLIIHVARLSDGTRRIVQVADVAGMESSVIQLNDLFTYDFEAGMDGAGRYLGTIHPTGIRPSFEQKLKRAGVDLNADIFADRVILRSAGGSR